MSDSEGKIKAQVEQQRLHERIEGLESELHQLRNSPSWKVSWPLRNTRSLLSFLASFFYWVPYQFSKATGKIVLESESCLSFILKNKFLVLPCAWNEWQIASNLELERVLLYVDSGNGFSEYETFELNPDCREVSLVCLPNFVRTLRADVFLKEVSQDLNINFRVLKRARISVYLQQLHRCFKEKRLGQLLKMFLSGNFIGLQQELLGPLQNDQIRRRAYKKWIKSEETKYFLDRQAKPRAPVKFSILLPVYNTRPDFLRAVLDSILSQTYQNFEVCVVDDASSRMSVRPILEQYQLRDPRIKVHYRTENGHISRATNTALNMATGEFVVLVDHDDILSPFALDSLAQEIQANPKALLLFSDEDRITDKNERIQPYFKPEFSWAMLLSQNLISHLAAYKTDLAKQIGGFRVGFEGSQDWDFALRFVDQLETDQIIHIPAVLYHWRLVPGTVSFEFGSQTKAQESACLAVRAAIRSRNFDFEVSAGRSGLVIGSKVRERFTLVAPDSLRHLETDLKPENSIFYDSELFSSDRKNFQEFLNLLRKVDTSYYLFLGPDVLELKDFNFERCQPYFQLKCASLLTLRCISKSGLISSEGLTYSNNQWSARFSGFLPQSLTRYSGYCSTQAVLATDGSVVIGQTIDLEQLDLSRLEAISLASAWLVISKSISNSVRPVLVLSDSQVLVEEARLLKKFEQNFPTKLEHKPGASRLEEGNYLGLTRFG